MKLTVSSLVGLPCNRWLNWQVAWFATTKHRVITNDVSYSYQETYIIAHNICNHSYIGRSCRGIRTFCCTLFYILKLRSSFFCRSFGITSAWVKWIRISNSVSLFTFSSGMVKDFKLPLDVSQTFIRMAMFSFQLTCTSLWTSLIRDVVYSGRDRVFSAMIGSLDAVLALSMSPWTDINSGRILIRFPTTFLANS
jgi:hypothetical protein